MPDLIVGDQVIVMALGESADRLHVLARLQGRPAEQGEVPGLVPRLEAIEARDTGQDARLDGAEAVNGQQGTRLDRVEGRAGTLELRAGAIEGVNSTQDGRLSAVETRNTQQDGRLSATEARANAAAPDNTVVHRSGAEQVSGVKTFADQPVIPPATLATSPVRSDDRRLLAGPVVEALLVTDYVGLVGNTWYGMRGNMSPIVDTHGMWTQPGSGLYTVVVPTDWPGRYELFWQVASDGTGYNPVIGIITLNMPPGTANAQVPGYSMLRMPGPGMTQVSGSAKLAAGATVGFGLHAVQAAAYNLRVILPGSIVRTAFCMRYVGPD